MISILPKSLSAHFIASTKTETTGEGKKTLEAGDLHSLVEERAK